MKISSKLENYFTIILKILIDISLCIICTWVAFVLRIEEFRLIFDKLENYNFDSSVMFTFIAIPIFWMFGLYRTFFRQPNLSIILIITYSIVVYGLIYFSIISIYVIDGVPRSIGVLQPILLFLAIITSRFVAKFLSINFIEEYQNLKKKEKILIYGAGDAGQKLFSSIENNFKYKVIGFLDDDLKKQNQYLFGQKIFNPQKIDDLIKTKNINIVLFAIPSIAKSKKNLIIENLSKYKLVVKTLPSANEIVDDKIKISDIRDFLAEDLLTRDEIKPDKELLQKDIKQKTILVTGAGGTIGSELCRQITKLEPFKLILLELNEFFLYKIHEELIQQNENINIVPLLANVQDQEKLDKIFEIFNVDTVYHSAAYKHVPLVESNICEGIRNNIFGTLAVTKAAINQRIKKLVLISTDKAVRPTNIMGVSKRFSELCIQGLQKMNKESITKCSIVRFGNVINSSGSVIPKFRRQIKDGGPVTLTHPDVTRYFMTIPEASQLVIQAGALAKNCETFLLDMGESVKIFDLIKKMIKLSGLTIKNDDNPEGDIDIKIIGLRPGEKLFEELLIGNNPQKTTHPKILKTKEPFIPYIQLEKILDELLNLLKKHKPDEVKRLLEKSVKLYNSNSEIIDHMHEENLKNFNNK